MVKVVVDYESAAPPRIIEEDVDNNINSAEDGHSRIANNEVTTISLSRLIQDTLDDPDSELGQKMKNHLSYDGDIPKRLIYRTLKEALENADPTKSVMIIDRRLSFDSMKIGLRENAGACPKSTTDHATQTPDETNAERKLSNDISVISLKVEQNASGRLAQNQSAKRATQPTSTFSKLSTKLKTSLFPSNHPSQAQQKTDGTDRKPNFIVSYFKKMRGGQKRPPYEHPLEALQSLIVSFVGIFVLTSIDYFVLTNTDYTLVTGSFGATAVLTFCAIKSPLAQPRNLICGHTMSAVIGVTLQLILGEKYPWLAAALAVSISIAVMSLTNTVHPPGGATALIAVYSSPKIHSLGFLYVVIPVTVAAIIFVLVAVLMNNMFPSRRYPQYWW